MKYKTQELKKIQKKLCDELIQDTEKIDTVINQWKNTYNGFHQYSINNILLADWQYFERTGDTIELLASYNTWKKKDRYVNKGEKSLKILAPRTYTETDPVTNEEIKKLYFVAVSVFDINQTSGKRLEEDMTINKGTHTFNEILTYIPHIKVNPSNKTVTKGSTDGEQIWISRHISDTEKICVLFHELAHMQLHFGEDRKELNRPTKELEAETVSYIISSYLGIENKESSAYIKNWYEDNPSEKINGLGEKLINTSNKILSEINTPLVV